MFRLTLRTVHPSWLLGALALSVFSNTILQTAVAPALPQMQHELGVSTAGISWVLTVALISGAVGVPIIGRLADMFGKKGALQVVALTVSTGCIISALSNSLGPLIVGRALQGLGAGVFPIAFAIVRDEFQPPRRAIAIGFLAAMWGPAAALGFPLSGVVVAVGSYRWIFWIALILTLISLAVATVVVPDSRIKTPAPIDWAGGALLIVGLGTSLLAVSQSANWGWSSSKTLGLLVFGLCLVALWARWELRVSSPLTDLRLLRQREVWTVLLPNSCLGLAMFSQFLLIPAFVETPRSAGYGFGASVTEAGLYLVPIGIMMLLVSPVSGFLAARNRLVEGLLVGIASCVVAFTVLALFHDNRWAIVLSTCLTGLGGGLTFAAAANLLSIAVPHAQIAEANAMSVTLRTVAASLGATIAAAILTGSVPKGSTYPSERAFTAAFALQAIAALFGVAAAIVLLRRVRSTRRLALHERLDPVVAEV